MYLENGDEVYETDDGRFILANSGAFCDEHGNTTGGCIDDEELDKEEVYYITATGKTYHTKANCPALKNKVTYKIKKSEINNRKPCKRCCK